MAAYYPCLDVIRISACYLVILLHVAAMQFERFFPAWPAALFYDAISRMSVPLFFMLSGFLLMESRIDSLARFYWHRYLRILLPFAFVCLLYYFTPAYAGYSPLQYLRHIAVHYVDYHLWYIYALIGIYLVLPFFIKIAEGETGAKLVRLYLYIWILAYILMPYITDGNPLAPEVAEFQAVHPDLAASWMIGDLFGSFFMNWNLLFFYGFMGYLLIGGQIRRRLGQISKGMSIGCLFLCIGATVAIILLTWRLSLQNGAPSQRWFHNLSPFVALQAVSFFVFACQFKTGSPLLESISGKCYWIYLLHLILLRFFNGLAPVPDSFWNIVAIPGYALVIFATALCAAIPLARLEHKLLKFLALS